MKITYNNTEINFDGGNISSNGGLLIYKAFAERIGLRTVLEDNVIIIDNKVHRIHSPVDCIEQQIFSIIAGHEDNSDVYHLGKDELFKHILDKDVLASQPTLCRHENSYQKANETELMKANLQLVKRAHQIQCPKEMIFDLDSSDDQVHGHQEGGQYNSYYQHKIYHPLFCFDGLTNDLLKTQLREGQVYTSNGVVDFIKPLLEEFSPLSLKLRGDSGFAVPELYNCCESSGTSYYIKLKKNSFLNKLAASYLLDNHVCPAYKHKIYFDLLYQAGSWDKSRRVLCKAEVYEGELFPSFDFIVTNDTTISVEEGFKLYNGRANVENCIKEIKLDLRCDKLSLQSFKSNACRLQVFGLAYNLNHLMRRLALPDSLKRSKLQSLRWRLIRIGCRVVYHARKVIVKLSSSYDLQAEYIRSLRNISLIRICPT